MYRLSDRKKLPERFFYSFILIINYAFFVLLFYLNVTYGYQSNVGLFEFFRDGLIIMVIGLLIWDLSYLFHRYFYLVYVILLPLTVWLISITGLLNTVNGIVIWLATALPLVIGGGMVSDFVMKRLNKVLAS